MSNHTQHLIRSFLPFFVVVFCLSLINWTIRLQNHAAADATATTVTTPQPTTTLPEAKEANKTAVVTPSPHTTTTTAPQPTPSATPYTPPTFDPETHIQLFAPPTNTTFPTNNTLTLYWQWPLPLTEDQFFAVYWSDGEQDQLVGTIDEANFGAAYRLHIQPREQSLTANTYQWRVQLRSTFTNTPLATSETHTLTLIDIAN